MPVPGVPTLDPVPKPFLSPGEAGESGAVVAGLGEESEGIALTGLELQAHIRRAQSHVDTLAARNEMDTAYAAMQTDLAKTQNSRDVPDVLSAHQKEMNDIARRWGKSPAAIQIQMDADALRPTMEHVSQMRQIDLMGKEFKVTLAHQREVLANDYAAARGAGDKAGESNALGGFTQAVRGGVQTGLMGDVEANEEVRLFRQAGQETQIQNAIASPDPRVNQSIFDQMNSDPKQFPDVTPEFMAAAKARALEAKESHIKHQEWADQEMVKQFAVPKIIKDNTDADGTFHLDAALKQASILPPGQEEIATKFLAGHADAANAELDGQLNKATDAIEDAIRNNRFNDANHIADQMRFRTEKAGLPWFSNQVKIIDAAKRQTNAEWRAEWGFDERVKKFNDDAASQGQASQMLPDVTSGRITEQQLTDALAAKKINYKNYLQLRHVASQIQTEPETKKALSLLYDSLPAPPKGASPADVLEYDNDKWNLYEAWERGVAEKGLKGEDKTKYAGELAKTFASKDVADRIDKILGAKPTAEQDSGSWFVRAKGESWEHWLKSRMGEADTPPKQTAQPSRPKNVPSDYVWNPSGNSGKGSWDRP